LREAFRTSEDKQKEETHDTKHRPIQRKETSQRTKRTAKAAKQGENKCDQRNFLRVRTHTFKRKKKEREMGSDNTGAILPPTS
jgi:hypothetical protein